MNTLKKMAAVLVALVLLLSSSPALQSAGGSVLIPSAQAATSPNKAPVTKPKTTPKKKQPQKSEKTPQQKIASLKVGHATTVTINGVTYTLKKLNKKGNLEVVRVTASKTKRTISVPQNIGPFKITSIGKQAFRTCKKVTTITLPNTINHIGAGAFSGCGVKTLKIKSKKLKKNSVKNALKGATKLKTVKVPKDVLKYYKKKVFVRKNVGRKVAVRAF